MAENKSNAKEPEGFTERTSGPASEQARELGWGIKEEQRTRLPEGRQPEYGGTDYDYGAQDFGDRPVDTSSTRPANRTAKRTDRQDTAK